MPITLSIIIPAYNEALRIGRLLDVYLPYFTERYGDSVEFIVAINGTTDQTQQVVESYRERYPQLRMLIEPHPIGKGGAVMQGMRDAQGEWIGYVDADGSTSPEAFQDLLDQAGSTPAVIASRWCRGAVVNPRQPFVRRLASRVFNGMTRLLFGLRLTDTQCGAKVFRREVVEAVRDKVGITRWAFDVDLLFQIRRAGFPIAEIPTTWQDVEGSKITVTESSLEMLAALVRLRLIYSPFRWTVKLYDRFIGGGGQSDHLLRHSVLIGMGSQVSNGANILFQIVMAHMLVGKDAVEYGVLSSMLGSVVMLAILFGSLGRSASHFTALACKERRQETIRPMIRCVARDMLFVAFVPVAVMLYLSPQLAEGFHLASPVPLIFMILTVSVQLFVPIFGGVLTGVQAFRSTALLGATNSILRLASGAALVMVGFGATGALLGNLLSTTFLLAFSVILVWRMLPAANDEQVYQHSLLFYRRVVFFALAAAGYALLTSSDVVLVKRFFAPEVAGEYALASMVARIVFFLPMPIAVAMFPKVVSSTGQTAEARRTFRKALLVSGVVFLVPAIALEGFPQLFVRILTSGNPDTLAPLVRLLVLVYLPFPVCTLVLNYELAQGRTWRVAWPMLVTAIAYILVAKFVDGGVHRVAYALGAAAYSCILWFLIAGILPNGMGRGLRHES